MGRRNRRSLIGRNPSSGRTPDNPGDEDLDDDAVDEGSEDDGSDEESEDESPDAGDSEDAGSDAGDSKEQGSGEAGSDDEGAAPEPSVPAAPPPAAADDPAIAPPMMWEDTVPAPEASRDLAAVEKTEEAVETLLDKKIETANPAPERTQTAAADVFPKDFEEEDDWFMKTGQPAPQRVEEKPVPVAAAPPAGSSSWPIVLGLLVMAGLIGIFGVLLVLLAT